MEERMTFPWAVEEQKPDIEGIAKEMTAALVGLFEHCVMVQKHWGEGANPRESTAAVEAARGVLRKIGIEVDT